MAHQNRAADLLRQFRKSRDGWIGGREVVQAVRNHLLPELGLGSQGKAHAGHGLWIFLAEPEDRPRALMPGGEHGRQLIHSSLAAADSVDGGRVGGGAATPD